jgi:hypothetical protein
VPATGPGRSIIGGMFPLVVDDVVPFEDWTAAARASLGFLHRTVGMDAWMVTRVRPPDQQVLLTHPFDAVPCGTSVPWEQSFCRSMVSGTGPRVATVATAVPAYRDLVTLHGERVTSGTPRRPTSASRWSPAPASCTARSAASRAAPSRAR